MPVYSYKCNNCGERFEKYFHLFFQSNEEITCPKCGSTNTEKLPSIPGKPVVK